MSTLEHHPKEVLIKIFKDKSISAEDLISISKVCRRFNEVSHYDELWKSKFQQRWPLALKKMNYELSSENWREEVKVGLMIKNKLEESLRFASYKCYKLRSINSTIVSSVINTFKDFKFGHLIVLNELHDIVYNEREINLTKKYYGTLILHYVNYYLVKKEIKELDSLEPEEQNMEKGAFYFAIGMQPKEYFNLDYEEISSKLDSLAVEVQSYLRTKYCNHPASSIELISPEEPLEHSKWSDDECEEILECIIHILFTEHKFRASSKKLNGMLLNKVLETEEGVYEHEFINGIVFKAVDHRLGIHLFQADYKSDSIMSNHLIWIATTSGKAKAMYTDEDNRSLIKWKYLRRESFVLHERCPVAVLQRLAYYSLEISEESLEIFSFNEKIMCIFGMIWMFESLNYVFNDGENFRNLNEYCLSHELYLETIIEVLPASRYFDKLYILTKAQKILSLHKKKPKSFKPKKREKDLDDDVEFATGMIMFNKLTNDIGVIIGWDEGCKLKRKKVVKKNENKAVYDILLSDGSKNSVAQGNLILKMTPCPINQVEVGKYFEEFNGTFYLPNEELRSEYPDDDDVKEILIKIFS